MKIIFKFHLYRNKLSFAVTINFWLLQQSYYSVDSYHIKYLKSCYGINNQIYVNIRYNVHGSYISCYDTKVLLRTLKRNRISNLK
jgi:hypothetical protein